MALTLAGCADDTPATPAGLPSPHTSAPDETASLVVPDLMDWIVEPAAAVLLAAADQHAWTDLEPRSDEAWQAVADAAAQLLRSGDSLAGPALAQGRPDWLQWSTTLRDGAVAGAAAARRRDPRGLYLAGVQLRTSCQACHARYAVPVTAVPGAKRPGP